MSNLIEIKVPDIGDFSDVDVIDVLVKAGDTVAVDDALITLESDKASMDIPSPQAGKVKELKIAVGDKVSEGTLVCVLESGGAAVAAKPAAAASVASGPSDLQCEMLVLGAGPGGYTAAFRAADLGMKTVLVERWSTLGGVCLNVGCIPSKALLHAAKVIDESEDMGAHGIKFAKPEVDIDALRSWKDKVVGRLTGGLSGLAKQRKVQVVNGVGSFVDANHVEV
ncbi:MAG: FAD-dependent oxidoreductase, partial [Gammaproteobacteria bacterium]|nr:FAD-dependent oxidoreductase [Gammaproteobacteria bacterium]